MDAIEEKNYIDAWRLINKDKREFSWYSNFENGFRIDHAFVNEKYSSKVLNCFYSHEEREEKISEEEGFQIVPMWWKELSE
jgi:exonuclease III